MMRWRLIILTSIVVVAMSGVVYGVIYLYAWQEEIKESSSAAPFLNFLSQTEDRDGHDERAQSMSHYQDQKREFSFTYPAEYTLQEMPYGETGRILVMEDKVLSGTDTPRGFQIFIAPFDENPPITKERIMQDIPDLIIREEHTLRIGDIDGFAFLSGDNVSPMYEVWFVHYGSLYQVTGFSHMKDIIKQTLMTWKFK